MASNKNGGAAFTPRSPPHPSTLSKQKNEQQKPVPPLFSGSSGPPPASPMGLVPPPLKKQRASGVTKVASPARKSASPQFSIADANEAIAKRRATIRHLLKETTGSTKGKNTDSVRERARFATRGPASHSSVSSTGSTHAVGSRRATPTTGLTNSNNGAVGRSPATSDCPPISSYHQSSSKSPGDDVALTVDPLLISGTDGPASGVTVFAPTTNSTADGARAHDSRAPVHSEVNDDTHANDSRVARRLDDAFESKKTVRAVSTATATSVTNTRDDNDTANACSSADDSTAKQTPSPERVIQTSISNSPDNILGSTDERPSEISPKIASFAGASNAKTAPKQYPKTPLPAGTERIKNTNFENTSHTKSMNLSSANAAPAPAERAWQTDSTETTNPFTKITDEWSDTTDISPTSTLFASSPFDTVTCHAANVPHQSSAQLSPSLAQNIGLNESGSKRVVLNAMYAAAETPQKGSRSTKGKLVDAKPVANASATDNRSALSSSVSFMTNTVTAEAAKNAMPFQQTNGGSVFTAPTDDGTDTVVVANHGIGATKDSGTSKSNLFRLIEELKLTKDEKAAALRNVAQLEEEVMILRLEHESFKLSPEGKDDKPCAKVANSFLDMSIEDADDSFLKQLVATAARDGEAAALAFAKAQMRQEGHESFDDVARDIASSPPSSVSESPESVVNGRNSSLKLSSCSERIGRSRSDWRVDGRRRKHDEANVCVGTEDIPLTSFETMKRLQKDQQTQTKENVTTESGTVSKEERKTEEKIEPFSADAVGATDILCAFIGFFWSTFFKMALFFLVRLPLHIVSIITIHLLLRAAIYVTWLYFANDNGASLLGAGVDYNFNPPGIY